MRRAIGSTWTFQIMLIFVLLFASFLAIYINFSRTFKLKNEVINIIEREEGMSDNSSRNSGAIQLIGRYLTTNAYSNKGYCPSEIGWYGATSIDGNGINDLEEARVRQRYYYCVRKVVGYDDKNFYKAYYEVQLFMKFDLPFIGNIYTFDVEGETVDIDFSSDNLTPMIYN